MKAHRLLALNVGSATLKAAAYTLEDAGHNQAPWLIERMRVERPAAGVVGGRLAALLEALADEAGTPDVTVHRIVHGGDRTGGLEIHDALMDELAAIAPMAPLHQPPALALASTARRVWPQARHGVAFDTSFHATLAPWSRRLPIPADWHAAGIRRYGFHGLAFASALRAVAGQEPGIHQGRAVFAHLGGGCSVCAVDKGMSRDTTMALTPLGGVPGPTRSGDLDPGIVFYLLRHTGLEAQAIEEQLSHHGGLVGIAGYGDVRRLLADGREAATLALEVFSMRIAQSVTAMATAIGGLDHLVFSGGIGHRAPSIRARIVAHLSWLGLGVDPEANEAGVMRFDRGTGPALWNAPIDEERELAESAPEWLWPETRASPANR